MYFIIGTSGESGELKHGLDELHNEPYWASSLFKVFLAHSAGADLTKCSF